MQKKQYWKIDLFWKNKVENILETSVNGNKKFISKKKLLRILKIYETFDNSIISTFTRNY